MTLPEDKNESLSPATDEKDDKKRKRHKTNLPPIRKRKTDLDDMAHGSLYKKIFLFSLPLVPSNVLQVFFYMADVIVVGKFGRDGALGAVGSTTTLVALFTGFLLGIGSGINAIVARYYGAKNP